MERWRVSISNRDSNTNHNIKLSSILPAIWLVSNLRETLNISWNDCIDEYNIRVPRQSAIRCPIYVRTATAAHVLQDQYSTNDSIAAAAWITRLTSTQRLRLDSKFFWSPRRTLLLLGRPDWIRFIPPYQSGSGVDGQFPEYFTIPECCLFHEVRPSCCHEAARRSVLLQAEK